MPLKAVAVGIIVVVFMCICFASPVELQHGEGDILVTKFDYSNDLHLVDDNNRNARSVSVVKNVFGKYSNYIMSKILPWQRRMPLLTGAKLVSKKGNTKYWEKPGGKEQFEKDLALVYRKRAENKPNVEQIISKGKTGKTYRLRLENINLKGEWSTDIITYF